MSIGIPCRYTTPLQGLCKYTTTILKLSYENVGYKSNSILISEAFEEASQTDATVIIVRENRTMQATRHDRVSKLFLVKQEQLVL